jgi:hypothetical protein
LVEVQEDIEAKKLYEKQRKEQVFEEMKKSFIVKDHDINTIFQQNKKTSV